MKVDIEPAIGNVTRRVGDGGSVKSLFMLFLLSETGTIGSGDFMCWRGQQRCTKNHRSYLRAI
jgi:hypothetical protein